MKGLIGETLEKISAPDGEISAAVDARLRSIFPGSERLGALRRLLLQYADITESEHPIAAKKCTVICCADHGVSAMGVSAYPPETTLQMTANYLVSRGGTANALCNFSGSDLLVVDLGIAADTSDMPELLQRKIAFGTENCALGPAMTREQAVTSIETGIQIALTCSENGYNCFLPGEMGIANTTSSAAICAAICGLPPEEATGRGTNISDERLAYKVSVVRQALERNRPDPSDGIDVLAKVGGFELGCIAGIILGAASCHAAVILDGFNTGAAALIATALAPDSRFVLMGSHLAAEQAHGAILQKLGISPCMDMEFRLGEATGSSIAACFLDGVIRLWRELEEAQEKEQDMDGLLSSFTEEFMPEDVSNASDRTFEFYLGTMPVPRRSAMDRCRLRIDNLAKPIYSLGKLEEIAVQMAGIADDDRPDTEIDRTILCFFPMQGAEGKRPDGIPKAQLSAMHALSEEADTEVVIAYLREGCLPTAAFDFGRRMAEDISFSDPILGLCVLTPEGDAPIGEELREALLTEKGELRYGAEEFLKHVPERLKDVAGALLGALIAGAHNSSLVILDDEATEIIARYAEKLCPDIRPYLLHVQPNLLQLGLRMDGGMAACLGMKVVDAALHMLNDMKTFQETSVPVATDGPGAKRQLS